MRFYFIIVINFIILLLFFINVNIEYYQITLIQKIGEGFFGEVWKGKWNQTQDIAIKKMKHEASNANDVIIL